MKELTDKSICIIGPRRLQNELMVEFLERETGTSCSEAAGLSDLSGEGNGQAARSRVILLDCMGKDPETCLEWLESDLGAVITGNHVALFNLRTGSGMEEKALGLGIRGFFYEGDSAKFLPRGVRAIFEGELWVSREIMARFILKGRNREPVSRKASNILTPRETEILAMVAIGRKNEDIAAELFISPNTVKTHIYNIFKKINVPNRLQAALWAARNL